MATTTDAFLPTNYASASSEWILTNAILNGDTSVTISPGGNVVISIPLSSSGLWGKKLKLESIFNTTSIYDRYKPRPKIATTIQYFGTTVQTKATSLFEQTLPTGVPNEFNDISEIVLNNAQINNLTITIFNTDVNSITISFFGVFVSMDIAPQQIAEVLKSDVISADVIKATANFSKFQFTDYLQTNVFALSSIEPLVNSTVDYFTGEGNELSFFTAILSDVDTEQFEINGQKFWYAIIGTGDDAYKYLTTIDPRDKFPDISDIDRDAFRYMVYSKISNLRKLAVRFYDRDYNGSIVSVPTIELGSGPIGDVNSTLGKGFIYKDADSLALEYVNNDGDVYRVDIGASGINLTKNGAPTSMNSLFFELSDLKFYDNGFVCTYSNNVKYTHIITEDISGKITSIRRYKTSVIYDDIPITYNTGSAPLPD